MTVSIIRPLVATALLAFAAPTFASPAQDTEKLVISTAGINLATPAGQRVLAHRVNAAIDQLCNAETFATADGYDALNDCRDEVRAEVQPQLKAVMTSSSTVVALR
jgi:UrcA family protein